MLISPGVSVGGGSLLGVGCRVLTVDCQVSLSVVVIGFTVVCMGVSCRVLVNNFWRLLSLTFSIVGASGKLEI